MWIYLLRHGVAEGLRAGLTDEERALTPDGWQQLRAAAKAWARLGRAPSLVVTSPLRRARESAETFAEATQAEGGLRVDPQLAPGSPLLGAVTLLEGLLLTGTESVALIGHEPHLGYLLGRLVTGQERLAVPIEEGMLVALEVAGSTSLLAELRFALSAEAAARLTWAARRA